MKWRIFFVSADVKLPGAERRSKFYQKYGNPNFGGMRGLISNSRLAQFLLLYHLPVILYSKNRRIGHLYKSSTFVRAPVQTFPTAFPIKCLFIRAPSRYNRHRPVFSFPKRQFFFIRRLHYNLSKSPIIHNDP